MTRITIDVDDDLLERARDVAELAAAVKPELRNFAMNIGLAVEIGRSHPPMQPELPVGVHVCPTCGGAKCERCGMTGRGSYARVYADNEGEGRASLQLWFGAAATMELVARSTTTLAHDRVDSILATLAEAPGVVIRDRRGR